MSIPIAEMNLTECIEALRDLTEAHIRMGWNRRLADRIRELTNQPNN